MTKKRRRIRQGSAFEEQIGYSRAVVDGRWVFVSGTTGFDYSEMAISDEILEQVEQTLANIDMALAEAGSCVIALQRSIRRRWGRGLRWVLWSLVGGASRGGVGL